LAPGTVNADNPSLTTRLGKRGRDPLRVILDSSLKISSQSKILHLDSAAQTLIFCSPFAAKDKIELLNSMDGVQVESVALDKNGKGLNLDKVLNFLGEKGICSLLVEGGAEIHGSFLRESLVDRVMLFVAPLFGGTSGTPLLSGFSVSDNENAPKLNNVSL